MRAMQPTRWLETLAQDVRYACRLLWRAKAFTVAAVLTLALGIAGATVMFALIQGVLLRPLPVRDQDRLVLAWREAPTSGSAQYPFGDTEIESVAAASRLLEAAAGVTRNGVGRVVMIDRDASIYVNSALVTGGFFDVLGVRPIRGRTLAVADEKDGAQPVVVISNGLWQRQYGGAEDVVGRSVLLGDSAFTIVGVMPPDLDYPSGVELWRTTSSVAADGPFADAARREVNLIGRLRPGVSIAQVSSEIAIINERLIATAPTEYLLRKFTPVVRPFADVVIGNVRPTILALLGAVALVLLIASANVSNLLLMRGEARRGELAVRAALGAGRGRLVRQLCAESFVLATVAGVVGVTLAWISLPALLALVPEGLPRAEAVRIDQTVVAFAVLVVFVAAMLSGLAPGLLSARADLVSPLRGTTLAVTGGASTQGRRILVVAQVALAITVLAGAGLLVRSVLKLQSIDLGLASERLVLLDLHLPAKYQARQARAQFLDEATSRLEAAPAIASVTPVNVAPFTDRGWDLPRVTAEWQSPDVVPSNPSLNLESIHSNYFATLEIPLVEGRAFTTGDREGTQLVAILSEDAAQRLWPGESAIGKRLKMGGPESRGNWYEVVGVAARTRYRTVTTPRPTLYLPAAQFQMTATLLVVRTSAPVESIASLANQQLSTIAPDVRVMRVAPFEQFLAGPLGRPRFAALLLGVFAVASLLLAAVGLYAVMAAYVRQRDREIAVRLALGATGSTVRRLVLSETLKLAGVGAALGVGGAISATRTLQGMLFEVHPLDPVSIAGAAVLLVVTAVLAAYGPMRRSVRADVMTTLRQ
jgi:putative ABC transport system permease protein